MMAMAGLFWAWWFDKPIVAVIRGYCLGGGLLTALAADIRIASDDSQFGVPAARLGLGYALRAAPAVIRRVGLLVVAKAGSVAQPERAAAHALKRSPA